MSSTEPTVIVAKVVAPEPPTTLCGIVIVSAAAKLKPGLLIVIELILVFVSSVILNVAPEPFPLAVPLTPVYVAAAPVPVAFEVTVKIPLSLSPSTPASVTLESKSYIPCD